VCVCERCAARVRLGISLLYSRPRRAAASLARCTLAAAARARGAAHTCGAAASDCVGACESACECACECASIADSCTGCCPSCAECAFPLSCAVASCSRCAHASCRRLLLSGMPLVARCCSLMAAFNSPRCTCNRIVVFPTAHTNPSGHTRQQHTASARSLLIRVLIRALRRRQQGCIYVAGGAAAGTSAAAHGHSSSASSSELSDGGSRDASM
jgi:hypothetical protein